jgi:hypothetical protein
MAGYSTTPVTPYPEVLAYDTMSAYSNGIAVDTLNGGVGWTSIYVDRANALGLVCNDTFAQDNNGDNLNGEVGGNWGFAFVDRTNFAQDYNYDSLSSYSNGQALAGLNGGTIGWNGVYFTPSTTATTFATSAFVLPFTVTLSNAASGSATFYYTTDGSTPTTSSTPYTVPISLSTTTTLSVLTVFPGSAGLEQRVDVATYPYSTYTSNWVTNVINNGGAQPAWTTISSVDVFAKAMVTNSLDTLMYALNVYVPDSLTAAITPLIYTAGNQPWTNHNFVAGDLTVNGLIGNASNKWLDTGVVPSTAFPNTNSGGLTSVITATSNTAAFDLGGEDASRYLDLACSWNNNSIWALTMDGTLNYISSAGFNAFFSSSRTSSTAKLMYYASTSKGFNTGYSASVAATGLPTYSVGVFCRNSSGSANYFSDRRQSFSAIHQGLTLAQTQTLYNLIQALRTSLGGGTV